MCDVRYSRHHKVYQCARGHVLCGNCRARLLEDNCHMCQGDIIICAKDFEMYLQGPMNMDIEEGTVCHQEDKGGLGHPGRISSLCPPGQNKSP